MVWIRCGSLLMFLGVTLGAFGAHALKDTPEFKERKRNSVLKRLIGFLNGARTQLDEEDLVPDYLLKQIDTLVSKLEDQLN